MKVNKSENKKMEEEVQSIQEKEIKHPEQPEQPEEIETFPELDIQRSIFMSALNNLEESKDKNYESIIGADLDQPKDDSFIEPDINDISSSSNQNDISNIQEKPKTEQKQKKSISNLDNIVPIDVLKNKNKNSNVDDIDKPSSKPKANTGFQQEIKNKSREAQRQESSANKQKQEDGQSYANSRIDSNKVEDVVKNQKPDQKQNQKPEDIEKELERKKKEEIERQQQEDYFNDLPPFAKSLAATLLISGGMVANAGKSLNKLFQKGTDGGKKAVMEASDMSKKVIAKQRYDNAVFTIGSFNVESDSLFKERNNYFDYKLNSQGKEFSEEQVKSLKQQYWDKISKADKKLDHLFNKENSKIFKLESSFDKFAKSLDDSEASKNKLLDFIKKLDGSMGQLPSGFSVFDKIKGIMGSVLDKACNMLSTTFGIEYERMVFEKDLDSSGNTSRMSN